MKPHMISQLRAMLLLIAGGAVALSAQTAETRHFWDFEGASPYQDKVGIAHATVTEATAVTLGDGHTAGTTAMITPVVVAGADQLAAVPGASLHAPLTGAFSFSGWFRLAADTANNRGIFDFSGNGFDGPQMLLTSANSLNFRVDGTGTYNLVAAKAGAVVEDDQWHFFAAVYDPALTTGTLKLYLDGSTVAASASRNTTTATSVSPNASCWLGSFNFTGASENKGLEGSLDDLAYYAGALTTEQIQGLFDKTLTPQDLAPARPAKVISFERNPATGACALSWESVSGTDYTVWGSADLASWEQLTPASLAGTGSPLDFQHTPAAPAPRYFYQIRAD